MTVPLDPARYPAKSTADHSRQPSPPAAGVDRSDQPSPASPSRAVRSDNHNRRPNRGPQPNAEPPRKKQEKAGKLAIGFFTIVDDRQHGFFGGYLLLAATGRPLEFHCTTPVRPTRAQRILYGATLRPFLFGDRIGRTLLDRTRRRADVVLVDLAEALAVGEHCDIPVALVLRSQSDAARQGGEAEQSAGGDDDDRPADHASHLAEGDSCSSVAGQSLAEIQLGRHRLALSPESQDDGPRIVAALGSWAERFDMLEPFQRIRQAITEARKTAA